MFLQPHVAKDEGVLSEVGDFSVKFLPMSEKVDSDVDGMSYVSCRVAGAVYVKDAYGIGEGFQRETQPVSDGFVNEGGVSSAV